MSPALSPSGMMTYRDCPRRFFGQSVARDIRWRPTPEKLRGSAVHRLVEDRLRGCAGDWDPGMDAGYASAVVAGARALVEREGYELLVEKGLAVDAALRGVPYGAGSAVLRARADVLLLPPGRGTPLLADVKTGRNWDGDHFQLRAEALLVSRIYGAPAVRYEYWYVDAGETVSGVVSETPGDVLAVMADMERALREGDFPATPNRFCRWCGYFGTAKCGAS